MSKAKSPRVFVPLIKVDEEQRLVYGRITAEELDQAGEVMDYDSSKPNFEKWSNDIHEASGGLSKGNVRVMHGLSVAGKLTDIAFDDTDKSIEVCAKIVDDTEWNKVVEGCYTGFSVGGKYGKKWKDGDVQKFTAVPNEVSIVDNPCVKSATFTMFKADGAEEAIAFQNAEVEDEQLEKTEATSTEGDFVEPSNTDVAAKATEMAKAANDGSTWMDHIAAAREELIKASKPKKDSKKKDGEEDDAAGKAEEEGEASDNEEEEAAEAADSNKADFTIANRLSQKWVTSDGQSFDKKADAESHEAELAKAAEPQTEADKLRARLDKAIKPAEPEATVELMEDFDRLGKAINALSTPMEDGKPVLEKGMYTINRFSNVLSDMASLSRSIKAEGIRENSDSEDATVSAEIIAAVKSLGQSFLTYATDQVTELLAGMDDEVLVEYYDYYYAAAKEDGENALAKDVCSLIEENKDASRELREEMPEKLNKAFGLVIGSVEVTDELSPPMQKRFDELQAENQSLAKVAGEAIEKVEELAKRVEELAEQPGPRAPNPNALVHREGDGYEVMGKRYGSAEEVQAALHDMVKTMPADQIATMLIKASQQSGGQQLTLHR